MAATAVERLVRKGASISAPETIEISGDVEIGRISGRNTTIHSGCRIFGRNTVICNDVQLGLEAPVTINNCYIGPKVKLKGGYFENAVFLEGATAGSGAQVRGGTILEEQASIAHNVGLKQTILFPFVTLGSLINFCDCLMAGGTSRKNHSEVGSSYIHFNFTPHQDKATPSLLGDVPRGVMLRQSPIFLGGQGGLVGPCRLAYGTVVAAGTICRKDQLKENYLIMEGPPRTARIPLKPGGYRNLRRIVGHNVNYLANLIALHNWHQSIRRQFIGSEFPAELAEGLITTLHKGIAERILQLEKLKEKIEASGVVDGSSESIFCLKWLKIRDILQTSYMYEGTIEFKDRFCEIISQQIDETGKDYLAVIAKLDDRQTALGSQWLQGIVDHIENQVSGLIDAK